MKLSAVQQNMIDRIAGSLIIGSYYAPPICLRRTVHSLQDKGLVKFAPWRNSYRYELTPKGQQHVVRAYCSIGYIVSREELTTIKMTSGNEKRYPSVIDNDIVKHWVGIGWVEEGEPSIYQRNTLPQVVGEVQS
jgi:hypothetical protein